MLAQESAFKDFLANLMPKKDSGDFDHEVKFILERCLNLSG